MERNATLLCESLILITKLTYRCNAKLMQCALVYDLINILVAVRFMNMVRWTVLTARRTNTNVHVRNPRLKFAGVLF